MTTPAQLRALELSSYARGDRIAPPMTFLSLAPATSASYPAHPLSSSPPRSESLASSAVTSPAAAKTVTDPIAASAAVVGPDSTASEVIAEALKNRRSSSTVSSESAGSVKQRFLKLGPVHWGEDKDGKGDWVDAE